MNLKSNIALIGFMGCGKTTFGRKLSKTLGMKFVDIDSEIERAQEASISDLFAHYGEDYFRALETEFCKHAAFQHSVISTGGGIVCNPQNMSYLAKISQIFFLDVPFNIIYARLQASPRPRPLFESLSKSEFYDLFKRRHQLYMKFSDWQCDIRSNTIVSFIQSKVTGQSNQEKVE